MERHRVVDVRPIFVFAVHVERRFDFSTGQVQRLLNGARELQVDIL